MSRPLLITDCDEVLLHMVSHFAAWLGESHAIDFSRETVEFGEALTRRSDGRTLASEEVWPLLDGFFATEMDRQTPVPGAIEALARIGEAADIVILTNLRDRCHAGRVAQLARHGVDHRVVCNQGGKGAPVARLIAEFDPSVAVFVDDIPGHHVSVAREAPMVWRLHLVAEPWLAKLLPKPAAAHARIDNWADAEGWIAGRFAYARSAAA